MGGDALSTLQISEEERDMIFTLPGFSKIFGGGKPDLPKPQPLPEREDPNIAAAAEKKRLAELKRKGRASTIVAGADEDKLGSPPLSRPEARSAL